MPHSSRFEPLVGSPLCCALLYNIKIRVTGTSSYAKNSLSASSPWGKTFLSVMLSITLTSHLVRLSLLASQVPQHKYLKINMLLKFVATHLYILANIVCNTNLKLACDYSIMHTYSHECVYLHNICKQRIGLVHGGQKSALHTSMQLFRPCRSDVNNKSRARHF